MSFSLQQAEMPTQIALDSIALESKKMLEELLSLIAIFKLPSAIFTPQEILLALQPLLQPPHSKGVMSPVMRLALILETSPKIIRLECTPSLKVRWWD